MYILENKEFWKFLLHIPSQVDLSKKIYSFPSYQIFFFTPIGFGFSFFSLLSNICWFSNSLITSYTEKRLVDNICQSNITAQREINLNQISIYQLISKVFGMRMQRTMHILVFKPFGSSHK